MSTKNNGWIKLHRQIFDNPVWYTEKFTRGQAWVDLLLLANYAPDDLFVRGIDVPLKRGDVGRSIVTLKNRWKWSQTKVKNYLNWLEKRGQIVQQKNNVTSVFSIVNYEMYQSTGEQNELQTGEQKYSRSTAEVQQKYPNKKVNKKENKNNINMQLDESYKTEDFDSYKETPKPEKKKPIHEIEFNDNWQKIKSYNEKYNKKASCLKTWLKLRKDKIEISDIFGYYDSININDGYPKSFKQINFNDIDIAEWKKEKELCAEKPVKQLTNDEAMEIRRQRIAREKLKNEQNTEAF